jgi:hypothetical protein
MMLKGVGELHIGVLRRGVLCSLAHESIGRGVEAPIDFEDGG